MKISEGVKRKGGYVLWKKEIERVSKTIVRISKRKLKFWEKREKKPREELGRERIHPFLL